MRSPLPLSLWPLLRVGRHNPWKKKKSSQVLLFQLNRFSTDAFLIQISDGIVSVKRQSSSQKGLMHILRRIAEKLLSVDPQRVGTAQIFRRALHILGLTGHEKKVHFETL